MTTTADLASFLEATIKRSAPITYTDVVNHFKDLPQLTGNWLAHPLCPMFGELDEEDHARGFPFRTAIVMAKERNMPGPGFFNTMSRLRQRKILEKDKQSIWISELSALTKHYKGT